MAERLGGGEMNEAAFGNHIETHPEKGENPVVADDSGDDSVVSFPETAEQEQARIDAWLREKYLPDPSHDKQ